MPKPSDPICPGCGGADWIVHYRGDVRLGRHPNYVPGAVLACARCGLQRLDGAEIDYTTAEYRKLVDENASPEHFHRLHDPEIVTRLRYAGLADLRGRVVADVGCGGGSFLDAVRGVASETLAIEPARQFHDSLGDRGHRVYSFAADAAADWTGRVDVACCFAVIEHIEDPASFVSDILALLKPGGRLVVSTPNADDWLLEFLPERFRPFFYRIVHRWYFTAPTLSAVLGRAGFSRVATGFDHIYDLSNALVWARDARPSGTGAFALLQRLDPAYRQILCETGRGDTLLATAWKPA